MGEITELLAQHVSVDSAEQIQQMLMFLNRSEGLSKHVDTFMQMSSLVQLNNEGQFILAMRPTSLEMEKEMCMADIMKQLGYGCTTNVSQCKMILSLFSPFNEITIARILGTVSRTYYGLEENYNSLSTFCSALGSGNVLDITNLNSWNTDVINQVVSSWN